MGNFSQNQSQEGASISENDKQFLMQNVFTAMDALMSQQSDKVLVSCLENIIMNMAQVDYNVWNGGA